MTKEKSNENSAESAVSGLGMRRFSLLSHDILSTLSEVVGGVQMLSPDDVTAVGRARFDRILASGEALSRLLDGIVQDGESDVAPTALANENVILENMLQDVYRRWNGRALDKDVNLKIEKSPSLPVVLPLDRTALDRILSNLISNAVKHSDQHIILLKVELSAKNSLQFIVRDQGPGFSAEAFENLFEFKARPEGSDKPGAGMGLHIAKELSKSIGGILTARNAANGGGVVTLSLPAPIWQLDLAQTGNGTDLAEQERMPDLSNLKVLLAEDNPTTQMVTVQMLSALGADIRIARDGLEAFEAFKKEQFDVVLSDIEMPRMSGIELIKAIRGLEGAKANTTLIALTAYVMRDQRERIYLAGCDGIMTKPLIRVEDLGRGILKFHSPASTLGEQVSGAKSAKHTPAKDADTTVVDLEIFQNVVDIIGQENTSELLRKLLEDTKSVSAGIAKGQSTNSFAEIRLQTHILISVAGAIGAVQLQGLAENLNSVANREVADNFDSLCKACLAGLAELQDFIKSEQVKGEISSVT